MPSITDRRNRSIIKVVKKSGILQENGEYWNGDERRDADISESSDKKKDTTQNQSDPPVDFFG